MKSCVFHIIKSRSRRRISPTQSTAQISLGRTRTGLVKLWNHDSRDRFYIHTSIASQMPARMHARGHVWGISALADSYSRIEQHLLWLGNFVIILCRVLRRISYMCGEMRGIGAPHNSLCYILSTDALFTACLQPDYAALPVGSVYAPSYWPPLRTPDACITSAVSGRPKGTVRGLCKVVVPWHGFS